MEDKTAHVGNSMTITISKIGGIAAILFLLYTILTMIIIIVLGSTPKNAIECFKMLHANRLIGMLRLDLLTLIFMPLYYLLFYGIYKAINGENDAYATIAILFVFIGITLFLATPSLFSMLNLSDKYFLSKSDIDKSQLLAAGESILASDMWHGSGVVIGSIMLQFGAILLSIRMLYGNVFNKFTGYLGIITHGLDLLHIILLIIFPPIGIYIMVIGGSLYLLWLPIIGIRLLQINSSQIQ